MVIRPCCGCRTARACCRRRATRTRCEQLVAELGADRTGRLWHHRHGAGPGAGARVHPRPQPAGRREVQLHRRSRCARTGVVCGGQPGGWGEADASVLSIHAANPYADYRNRSLWAILGAVLCHPITDWAREQTALLVTGAFAPARIRFREGFRIAVQCRRAAAGDPAALAEFERAVQGTRDGAAKLRDARWESDAWGNACRRFACLAEAAATALENHALASALLDEAAALPKGFAGYQAPASLTLTEANSIVRSDNLAARDAALEQSLNSAHNVQDPGFCARTTARVNAMKEVWWAGPLASPAAVIDAFVQDPFSRRFAPVHHVGEDFPARPKTDERIAIDEVTDAGTLVQLAGDVFHVPVSAFERLNPGVPRNAPLGVPTVAVPDPKFAPSSPRAWPPRCWPIRRSPSAPGWHWWRGSCRLPWRIQRHSTQCSPGSCWRCRPTRQPSASCCSGRPPPTRTPTLATPRRPMRAGRG